MKSKQAVRKWLAVLLLLISLSLIMWANWPLNRVEQTVPLPQIEAPIGAERVR